MNGMPGGPHLSPPASSPAHFGAEQGRLPTGPGGAGDVQAVAALGDPARRALYAYVTGAGRPVTRDEAAAATGMKRATATFHLERMVSDGLLAVEFARVSGRAGPGAGRTAKLYTRACRQIAVSLPPRQYELAATIMARALDEA